MGADFTTTGDPVTGVCFTSEGFRNSGVGGGRGGGAGTEATGFVELKRINSSMNNLFEI